MLVTIVCDHVEAVRGISESKNVRILRACYGKDFLDELRASDAIAVPLAVDDISAGQMVIIQAMALGKPVVVTLTPTVAEYMTDGVEGLLVPRRDVQALRDALIRLQTDPELCGRLGDAGRAAYHMRFDQNANVRQTVHAIEELCARRNLTR